MNLSERLRDLRESQNLKQKDLAEKLHLRPNAVSRYERGFAHPSIPTLIAIAGVFQVSVDYLLGVSSVPNPYTMEKFSPEETEIIAKYRRLSKENKIRIDERLNVLAGEYKPE